MDHYPQGTARPCLPQFPGSASLLHPPASFVSMNHSPLLTKCYGPNQASGDIETLFSRLGAIEAVSYGAQPLAQGSSSGREQDVCHTFASRKQDATSGNVKLSMSCWGLGHSRLPVDHRSLRFEPNSVVEKSTPRFDMKQRSEHRTSAIISSMRHLPDDTLHRCIVRSTRLIFMLAAWEPAPPRTLVCGSCISRVYLPGRIPTSSCT
jgi:hypothetical protein